MSRAKCDGATGEHRRRAGARLDRAYTVEVCANADEVRRRAIRSRVHRRGLLAQANAGVARAIRSRVHRRGLQPRANADEVRRRATTSRGHRRGLQPRANADELRRRATTSRGHRRGSQPRATLAWRVGARFDRAATVGRTPTRCAGARLHRAATVEVCSHGRHWRGASARDYIARPPSRFAATGDTGVARRRAIRSRGHRRGLQPRTVEVF